MRTSTWITIISLLMLFAFSVFVYTPQCPGLDILDFGIPNNLSSK